MQPGHHPLPVNAPPLGDICVLRDDSADAWTVAICRGAPDQREVLARFTEQSKAAQFAMEERQKRQDAEGADLSVHFPDDCPCGRLTRAS